jgi:hypothetical protein
VVGNIMAGEDLGLTPPMDGMSMFDDDEDIGYSAGQTASNNLITYWNYNAVAGDASGDIETYGRTNNIQIDAKDIIMQTKASAGNVGIGTDSPESPMVITKNHSGFGGTYGMLTLTNTSMSASYGSEIRFQHSPANTTYQSAIRATADPNPSHGAKLQFLTADTGNTLTERMRIDSAGGLHQSVSSSFAGSKAGITEGSATEILNIKFGDGYGEGGMVVLDLFNYAGDTYAVKCERWLIGVRHGGSDATTVANIFRSTSSSENAGWEEMDDATVTTVVDGDGDIHIKVNATVSGSSGETTYFCYYKVDVVSNTTPVFTAG